MELNEIEEMVKGVRADLDNILNLAKQSEDNYNYEQKLSSFKERNSEKLDKYVDRLKKLNGDDFDLYKSAMDEYDSSFSDLEETDYIEQLVAQIDSKIDALKEALSDTVDETVENVTVESEGDETKVEAENTEGEPVAEAETNNDTDVNSEVSETEEEAEQPGEEEAAEEENDEKELEDFQKELDEEYELYKKHEKNKDEEKEEE